MDFENRIPRVRQVLNFISSRGFRVGYVSGYTKHRLSSKPDTVCVYVYGNWYMWDRIQYNCYAMDVWKVISNSSYLI